MTRRVLRSVAGFSMVEVMTVLVIMGIVLAAAVPNVSRYMRHDKVRMAAENFKSACMVTQKRAMSSRVRHRVVYNPVRSVYYVERINAGTWEFASADSIELPRGVSMNGGTESNPGHHIITFEALGTVTITDVPASISFTNGDSDSSAVSLVRTGRMLVKHF